MSIAISDTEEYRAALEGKLKRHASKPVSLIIVDDVAAWAKDRVKDATGNPAAMAVTESASGAWRIILRRQLSEDRTRGVLDRLFFGGYLNAAQRLNKPGIFLEHLVLHELAHLENKWGQDREDDCDEWAFERLGRSAI